MEVVAMTPHQLQALSPQLELFVRAGFVAAFEGDGGLFVVYRPNVLPALGDAFYVCTMRERPTLIELEDNAGNWGSRALAVAVAKALAGGLITARPNGATLVVSESDADRADAAPPAPVRWLE